MNLAIGALSIRKKSRVLLVCKRGVWILPGGKPEEGEGDRECLTRELKEELPKATFSIGRFFGSFDGTTPHTKREITALVYFTRIGGDLTPAREIERSQYFSVSELDSVTVLDLTREIIESAITVGRLQ